MNSNILTMCLALSFFAGCILDNPENKEENNFQKNSSSSEPLSSEGSSSSISGSLSSSSNIPLEIPLPTSEFICVDGKLPSEFVNQGRFTKRLIIKDFNGISIALDSTKFAATIPEEAQFNVEVISYDFYDFDTEGTGSLFIGDMGFEIQSYAVVNLEGNDVIEFNLKNSEMSFYSIKICETSYEVVLQTENVVSLTNQKSIPEPEISLCVDGKVNNSLIDVAGNFVYDINLKEMYPTYDYGPIEPMPYRDSAIVDGIDVIPYDSVGLTYPTGAQDEHNFIDPGFNQLIITHADAGNPDYTYISYFMGDAGIVFQEYSLVEDNGQSKILLGNSNSVASLTFELCSRPWVEESLDDGVFSAVTYPMAIPFGLD